MIKPLILSISIIVFVGCSTNSKQNNVDSKSASKTFTFLALGDSYTIGESVEENLRWPVQLTERFNKDGLEVTPPRIIATTGWTTDKLTKALNDAEINRTYDMVSLLIGVNNQYRGYEFDQYTKEFRELLQRSIELANNKTSNVFVVSIPDYGVTPFGSKKDPQKIALEIEKYNTQAKAICDEYRVTYINITDISKKANEDLTLVAEDGLHPSGKMYTKWVDIIYPSVKSILKQ